MKKVLIISLSILSALTVFLTVVIISLPKNEYFYNNKNYVGAFGYLRYFTINTKMNEPDKSIAENVIADAKNVFEYTGNIDNANHNVNALDRYYEYDCISAYAEIELITAKTLGSYGFMWVTYSEKHIHLDSDGNKWSSGSSGIVSFWRIKRIDGKWKAIKIKEAP